jgi:type II secretory pathway component GspD/PulD (secretin)
MKSIKLFLPLAGLAVLVSIAAAQSLPASDQTEPGPTTTPPTGTASTNEPTSAPAATPDTNAAPPAEASPAAPANNGSDDLRLNFRGAPLSLVLDYLSDAAGFIINKETEVKGTVDVWSKDPVSKDDAVKLLNSVLRKNGYAVTRDGRILTIVSLETAKTSDLDILQGEKWQDVEKSAEVVTQVIPVRYANATQLMNNLQILLPTTATLAVNESANSLILVASKTDIRRMLKIVSILDTSIASVSSIKVFPLRYADAKELATVIQQLFTQPAAQNAGGNARAQFFNMMRGGGFGGPGGPGGQGNNTSGSATGSKVTAAADEYSNSLIVSASTELMATISEMVTQIDQPATDVTELRVFHLVNADPSELADQLATLFPDDTKTGTGQNQGGGGGGFRFFGGRNNQAATSSDRMKKKGRVLAVPDPRTSSLLVSAAGDLMPQIAEMITQLDSSPAKKEVVKVFDLQNADPQDVNQVMQDLFQRSGNIRANNNNTRTSLLGQGNPLTQRSTQQQTTPTTTSSGFGNTRGGQMGTGF